jgi:hypothetical protein
MQGPDIAHHRPDLTRIAAPPDTTRGRTDHLTPTWSNGVRLRRARELAHLNHAEPHARRTRDVDGGRG